MIDQSTLKVFILLMDRDDSNYQVNSDRIKNYLNKTGSTLENNSYSFSAFANEEFSKDINLPHLFKTLCGTFPIFDFIFSDDFSNINNESIMIIRNNQEFLKELFDTFSKEFVDPAVLSNEPDKFISFAEGFAQLGYETDLLPNMLNLKELLLLV